MAFNEHLGERVEQELKEKKVVYEAKRMFGGITYLVDGKMCIGIIRDNLMIRIDPEDEEKLLKIDGCSPMDFTKRPLKGYLYISPMACDLDEDLADWIQKALNFNPKAKKSSKKK